MLGSGSPGVAELTELMYGPMSRFFAPCKKCGSLDNTVRYHRAVLPEDRKAWRPIGPDCRYYAFCERTENTKEHLNIRCDRCLYEWHEDVNNVD